MRIAANYVYLSDSEIIRNGFVQIEADGSVSAFGSLEWSGEIAGTRFLDGVILPFEPTFSAEELERDLFEVLGSQLGKRSVPDSADAFWLLSGANLARRVAGFGWKVYRLTNFV